jgi:hypothetical protein
MTASDSTPAVMSLSTASSIFPPPARYSPPSNPYDSGGLGSYTFPYSRTVGYAEAWGYAAYPSSTPGFLPPPEQPQQQQQQQPLHATLPLSNSITAPYFAPTEDVSMYDAASVPPPPAYYNPPFVPPAELMVWSSLHEDRQAYTGSNEQQQQPAFPMAFPPRRPNLVPDGVMATGPQPDYSFGTGGRRTLPASAHPHPDPRTASGDVGGTADVSGHVQHTSTSVPTAVAVENHSGGEDKGSPGGTSNTTATPMQTTPKQLTPRHEQPDSPLPLQGSASVPAVTTIPTPSASDEARAVSDDSAGVPSGLSGDSVMLLPGAAQLAANRRDVETAPSSTPSSSPVQSRPTPPARVMPHPLAPFLPPSPPLSHGPPSAPSTHSAPGLYPLPSPALDHPSVSSSRFGSIDSGRLSLFSGISSGAEAESISSVPASVASDSCGSLVDDTGIGGVFERDVQGLPSDHRLHISLATSPVTRLEQQQARSSTTGTGTVIPVSFTCTTGSSTAAPSTMLPPPLSYSLVDTRRASCPALLDSSGNAASLPQPVVGAASTQHGEEALSSPARRETSASLISSALRPSRERKKRPPVPTPVWDPPPPSATRRAAPSFSTSSSFTVRDETSAGPSSPASSPSSGGSRSTVFPPSAHATTNHAPKRVSSVPVLTRGSLSAAPSPTSRSSGAAGLTPSLSSPSALNLGPAYESVPAWERVAPPYIDLIHSSTARLAALASASASDTKDISPRSDEMYQEALVPIGESPSSTSGGSSSTPFTTTPATTVGWYDHPTVFVRSI